MATIPTQAPERVTAGDTVAWLRSYSDYPASAGWSVAVTLINAIGKITLTSTASGDDHLIQASAATSAGWAAGDYAWQETVSKDGERYTTAQGRITVAPSFAASATLDNRSNARKALEALESAYVEYISNGQGHVAEYEIAGRRMKFRNAAEIWQQIDRLKREVAAEDRAARLAAGLPARRRVLVRFGA